jgi:hypothetical protein
MSTPPDSGQMQWSAAVAGPLAGATCLWQDLDGLHVEQAPADPPPASILWAWRPDNWLVRVRLDGNTAFVAVHDGSGAVPAVTVPWDTGERGSAGDGRIAASRGRGPERALGGVGAVYEQVVVDGITDRTGPVTFIRPVPGHG